MPNPFFNDLCDYTARQTAGLFRRETELKRISDFIHSRWRGENNGVLLISGDSGSGKTSLLLQTFNDYAQKLDEKSLFGHFPGSGYTLESFEIEKEIENQLEFYRFLDLDTEDPWDSQEHLPCLIILDDLHWQPDLWEMLDGRTVLPMWSSESNQDRHGR